MAAKQRNPFKDFIVYALLRIVSCLVHCFPINLNLVTARFIGSMLYRFDRRHRLRALGNLRRSFPEKSEKELDRIARRSVQHFIMLGVEVLFTTRLIRLDTWRNYVELESFTELVSLLMKKKQGLVTLTGHYGNWEILGYVMAVLGFETTSVARPLDNPYVNQWLLGVRERRGQKIIDKKGATDDIMAVLGNYGTLGFIADQNAGKKGMFVDFFGRKASTYKSIGLVAMQYEVPIVIGYARRMGDIFRYHIGVQDIIHPADWKDQPDPLRYITQRYTKAIEDLVRTEPTQYLWVHRRWKTRPKGEAPETYD